MKAIIRGLNMAGEIKIPSVRPEILMIIHKQHGIILEEELSTESATKVIVFRFVRQIDKDLVLYELEGWR